MAFKLRSQKSIKKGGFKMMGSSSPLKSDDPMEGVYTPKDDEISGHKNIGEVTVEGGEAFRPTAKFDPERYLELMQGSLSQGITDPGSRITATPTIPADSDKPEETTNETKQAFDKAKVRTKTRTIDGKKDVVKTTKRWGSGEVERFKEKFGPTGVKSKYTQRKDDPIYGTQIKKTKTVRGKTKTSTRDAGSLLTDAQKAKVSTIKGKVKSKVSDIKSKVSDVKSKVKDNVTNLKKSAKSKSNKPKPNNSSNYSASSTDQMTARKKFQDKMGGIIPNDTKLTYDKSTGKYTYSSVKGPVFKLKSQPKK